jgi:hypothetical protein
MRLTPAQASQLAHLAQGGSLPKSRLTKTLLRPLQEAGAVRLEKSGSGDLVRGLPGKVEPFAELQWGVRDLQSLAQAGPENRSRESLAQIAGDSKALPNRPLAGIFIRSFGNCYLRGQPLASTPHGSAIFISPAQLAGLEIRAATLIAIENPACLLSFEKALPHFPELNISNLALVLRWSWGAAWRHWIQQWKGILLHFPDYDPEGLRIFANEVLPQRPDARLLIPSNLTEFLKERGSRKLFLSQEYRLPNLAEHPDILFVKARIEMSRRALEQEKLLF